jgi:hypothetical protein
VEARFEHWQQWNQESQGASPYLIEGLLHDGSTIMSGKAMAGKTNLCAAMVAAVAGSDDAFLGHAVHRHGAVMVSCTDPREGRVWGQRMHSYKPSQPVLISQHSRDTSWDSIVASVATVKPALFVLDNALGSISGDVRDNAVASRLLTQLDRIVDQDVAVLLLHHSSAKRFEDGTWNKGPMGSTAYDAWDRLTVHVEKSGEHTTLLSVNGNDCASTSISLDVQFNQPYGAVYSVNRDEIKADKRPRTAEILAAREAWVRTSIIGNAALTGATSQKLAAEVLNVSQSAVQRAISEFPGNVGYDPTSELWVLDDSLIH